VDELPPNKNRTSYLQGKDEGIGYRTVEKNAVYAKGIDAIREVSPQLAVLCNFAIRKVSSGYIRNAATIHPET
jgi:hypothetical protein